LHIPFSHPFAIGGEIDCTCAAVATPKFSGDGSYTAHCYTETISQRLQCFLFYTGMPTTEPAHAIEAVGELVVR
jgi:hypothetical protein